MRSSRGPKGRPMTFVKEAARPEAVSLSGTCLVDRFTRRGAGRRLAPPEGGAKGSSAWGRPTAGGWLSAPAAATRWGRQRGSGGAVSETDPDRRSVRVVRRNDAPSLSGAVRGRARPGPDARRPPLGPGRPGPDDLARFVPSSRETGIRDEPKSLIRRLPGVELVELGREQECCGFGGTFSIRDSNRQVMREEGRASGTPPNALWCRVRARPPTSSRCWCTGTSGRNGSSSS
jgi:hypothetical protein